MAFVIAIYWSMDSTRFERLWLSLLPPARRTRVRRFLGRLERSVGAYVRSEILQTLLAGTLLTALYALIGIPYPFLLATLIALTWLIPILGGAVALIVAVLVGWFASWSTAVMAGGATLLVLALMEYIVQPRLYRGQRYWGILTVILMLALGDAFGLIGVLVAPPIALILQMLIDGFLERDQAFVDQPVDDELNTIRTDLDTLKLQIAAGQDRPSAKIADLVARLERLVDETEEAVR
jgi:predicted PurR-regulated permease PerM